MPCFLILFRRCISLALLGADMHDNRICAVLYLLECLNQRRDIIAILDKYIIQSHRTEQIACRLALGIAQQLQILIQTAVIFCDGHIIVIDDNNQIAVQLCCKIQTFKRFAAAQRAISDNRNDILAAAEQISALCQTASQADGSRRVPNHKEIMRTLARFTVTGYIVIVLLIQKGVFSSGQHLVAIALMRNIKDHFILWRIKHGMQCNRCFDHTKVWAKVSAMLAQLAKQCLPHLLRQHIHLLQAQFFHIVRAVNSFQIHEVSSLFPVLFCLSWVL